MNRFSVEIRSAISGNKLEGHAAIFGAVADMRAHYEQMDRHAFDEALKTSDTRFLVNHDPSQLLGRQSSGTLRMGTDSEGLAFEVDLPNTQLANDIKELVSRGDMDGGSFGFIPGKDAWSKAADGKQLRTHTSIQQLLDASLVTYPAYAETNDIVLRMMEITPRSNRERLIRARQAQRS